ncbi:MAG: HD-GYP domain-containing protein [Bacillota bacterium]
MRIVPTKLTKVGMRLGRPVMDAEGRLVLAAGVTLRQRYIELLVDQGYASVYIADDLDQIELPEVVSLETRQEVIRCVMDFVGTGLIKGLGPLRPVRGGPNNAKGDFLFGGKPGGRPNPELAAKVTRVARMIVDDILSQKDVVIGLLDIKSLHDYTYAHSVQVALIAMTAAKVMGFNKNDILDLGIGSLLHDVGKVAVPDYIWTKPDHLTPEEFSQVKLHSQAGFDFLRKSDVGLLPAHVAFQHHERWNGTGYPRGLKGEQILKLARLCAVCDVYDAITSDRPYKEAVHPSAALAFLSEKSGTLFEPTAVEAVRAVVAPYPVATNVILSTGETAVVKKINNADLYRPVVVVTRDRDRRYYKTRREIDLSQELDISVVDYFTSYDSADAADA